MSKAKLHIFRSNSKLIYIRVGKNSISMYKFKVKYIYLSKKESEKASYEWKKKFAAHITDKELVSEYIKNLTIHFENRQKWLWSDYYKNEPMLGSVYSPPSCLFLHSRLGSISSKTCLH